MRLLHDQQTFPSIYTQENIILTFHSCHHGGGGGGGNLEAIYVSITRGVCRKIWFGMGESWN